MKTSALTRFICLLLAVTLTPILSVNAEDSASDSEKWGYVFKGLSPLKEIKKEYYPVVGANRKRVLVDTPNGIKKAKYGQSGLSLKPSIELTPYFAQLSGVQISLENHAQLRRDNAVQNALLSEASEAQDAIDRVNSSSSERVSGQPQNMSKEEFGASAAQAKATAESFLGSINSRGGEVADTVLVSLDVVSEIDVENAYAVVALFHDAFGTDGKVAGRAVITSLEKWGDLTSAASNRVEFRLTTREQLIQNIELKINLFSGEGTPIATTASEKLQEINLEEKGYIEGQLAKASGS